MYGQPVVSFGPPCKQEDESRLDGGSRQNITKGVGVLVPCVLWVLPGVNIWGTLDKLTT